MESKMDDLGDTVTSRDVWKRLEEKVGYIAFFAHFHDNPLAGFPRTKFKLPENMMHMRYYSVNKKIEAAKTDPVEREEEVKPHISEDCVGKKSTVENLVSGEVIGPEETVSAKDISKKPANELGSSEMKTPGRKVSDGCKIDSQVAPEKANPGNVDVKGRFNPEVHVAHFPCSRQDQSQASATDVGIQISRLNSHFPPAKTTPSAPTQPLPRTHPAALMPRAPTPAPRNAAAPPLPRLPAMRRPR
jgi:hypothetical protein